MTLRRIKKQNLHFIDFKEQPPVQENTTPNKEFEKYLNIKHNNLTLHYLDKYSIENILASKQNFFNNYQSFLCSNIVKFGVFFIFFIALFFLLHYSQQNFNENNNSFVKYIFMYSTSFSCINILFFFYLTIINTFKLLFSKSKFCKKFPLTLKYETYNQHFLHIPHLYFLAINLFPNQKYEQENFIVKHQDIKKLNNKKIEISKEAYIPENEELLNKELNEQLFILKKNYL